jgi:DNA-binding MltR family transcriptional regulator
LAKKKLRTIVNYTDLPLEHLLDSADQGTDSACALLCGAYIENATGDLLQKTMIDDERARYLLNDFNGFLSSASARNSLCYCLGLIDKAVYDTAKHIAVIRNIFAHSHVPIGFDHKPVADECNRLQAFLVHTESGRPEILRGDKLKDVLKNRRRKLVLATGWALISISTAIYISKAPPKMGHYRRIYFNYEDHSQGAAVLVFGEQ